MSIDLIRIRISRFRSNQIPNVNMGNPRLLCRLIGN